MKEVQKPTIIAEIGCNHKGDIENAKEMIKVASQFCKVDVVKFQKRNPRELLTEEEYNSPHPNPIHSYGETYGEHREALEFTLDQHRELMEFCQEWNVLYSTSVWDLTSAKEIVTLNQTMLKFHPLEFKLNVCYLADHFAAKYMFLRNDNTFGGRRSLIFRKT